MIDDGCPSSVGGLNSIVALADMLNVKLELESLSTPFFHFFGTEKNSSKGAWTVGIWQMPLRFLSGFTLQVPIACVPGDDPILLGADFLDNCLINNPANKLVLVRKDGKTQECTTYKHSDGHRYLEVAPRTQEQQHYSDLQGSWRTLQQKMHLVQMLQDRTHAPPASLRVLMQRNGLWCKELTQHVEDVCRKCNICLQTGRPLPSRKVSLTHIEGDFNSTVGVDFFYWNRTQAHTVPCLHAMCMGTALSEAEPVSDRAMANAASLFETLWIHQHGRPASLAYDPEFNSKTFLAMLRKHGIAEQPRPARRHNKMGRVERKHQTIKLILSRLSLSYPQSSDRWLVKFAIFLCNVLVGNKIASSFELARGYTPALYGTSMLKVPEDILEAHKNLIAHRTLQRVLRSKSVTPLHKTLLTPGTDIYAYVETKKGYSTWRPYKVLSCDGVKVEVRSSKRGPKALIALEDVRLRPTNKLARDMVENELGIQQESRAPSQQETDVNSPDRPALAFSEDVDQGDQTSPVYSDPTEGPANPLAHEDETSSQSSSTCSETIATTEEAPEETAISDPPQLPEAKNSSTLPPGEIPAEHQASSPAPAADVQIAQDSTANQSAGLRRSKRVRKAPEKLNRLSHRSCPQASGKTLSSLEQEVLATVHAKHGTEQFTKSQGRDVPEWLYDKALQQEMENWRGQYSPCPVGDVPPGSNIVGSHVVYRVKVSDTGEFKFKARLVVHGNEDAEKDNIRKDSATAHLTTIRLILSMAVCFNLKLGKIDIKAAYFQSGAIRRQIFVRPPRELLLFRTLWRLLGLPYGIVEAGRQWQLASDDFLNEIGLEPVHALPQCFLLRRNERVVLLVGKIVDDFLIAGLPEALKWFSSRMHQRFTIGTETYPPEQLRFNGGIIEQAVDFSIKLSMEEFAKSIERFDIARARRKQGDAQATANELRTYQSLAGKMNWLGQTATPQYAFAASYLQQNIGGLKVKHLLQANGVLREAQKTTPSIVFGKLKSNATACLTAFTDAAFPKIDGSIDAQTGILCGLVIGEGPHAAFHPIAWTSHKQKRICRSASAAEIMSIAEAVDFGYAVRTAVEKIAGRTLTFELNVDSRSLFEAITTQHESKDFRLRQAVQSIRQAFERGEISTLRWIPGKVNPADALTKRHATTSPLLNEMVSTGRLCLDFSSGVASID